MRRFIFFILIFQANLGFCQWTNLGLPISTRYDDIFFINDSTGWAVGTPLGIFKTSNKGSTWTQQFRTRQYLRCVEFLTPNLGFCGTLDSAFYRTTDGGTTWTDISNSISPKPEGICGLSAPTPRVVYGCGIWSSPAYVIKSVDGGSTWTSFDLSAFASALVDIHFISPDTGFVVGKSRLLADGGIILYTTNGGVSWAVKHKTRVAEDYVWKMQTPDGIHFYCALDAHPASGNLRLLQSNDRGMTWSTKIIRTTFVYTQAVGFLDTLRGFIGNSELFQTTDGGLTWQSQFLGAGLNRFFRMSDSTAYLSGAEVFKYKRENTSKTDATNEFNNLSSLKVSPNPSSDNFKVEIDIKGKTYARLAFFSLDGKKMFALHEGPIDAGVYNYEVSVEKLGAQPVFLVLKTNEGLVYEKLFIN
jgi:photosystem II stability/assembly factor-like uncharacterized protein